MITKYIYIFLSILQKKTSNNLVTITFDIKKKHTHHVDNAPLGFELLVLVQQSDVLFNLTIRHSVLYIIVSNVVILLYHMFY